MHVTKAPIQGVKGLAGFQIHSPEGPTPDHARLFLDVPIVVRNRIYLLSPPFRLTCFRLESLALKTVTLQEIFISAPPLLFADHWPDSGHDLPADRILAA